MQKVFDTKIFITTVCSYACMNMMLHLVRVLTLFCQVQCQQHSITIVELEKKLLTSLAEASQLQTKYEQLKLKAAELEQEKCEYQSNSCILQMTIETCTSF